MPRQYGKPSGSKDSPSSSMEGLSASEPGREEFLAALAQLDPAAARDEAGEEPAHTAKPRRLKQLERGVFKPAAELDLHGLTREEAVHRARAFVGHAARQGWDAVVIITGKGLHSQEGPVLRHAVEQLLANSSQQVLEWASAPRRYGGAGALVVFLRRQAK